MRGKSIQVTEVLAEWMEESLTERVLRRFFRVMGHDEREHTIFFDVQSGDWHASTDQGRGLPKY